MKRNSCFLRKAATAFLIALAVSALSSSSLVGFCDVSQKIDAAETAVHTAFLAVLEAEKAGANVSDLLVVLNDAGELVAEIEISYRTGNLSQVDERADEAISMANNVENTALSLKSSALAVSESIFWSRLIFSTYASLAFVVILIIVWKEFKNHYVRKLLKMKPKVVSNAES